MIEAAPTRFSWKWVEHNLSVSDVLNQMLSSDEVDTDNNDYGNDADSESESDNNLDLESDSNDLDNYAAIQNVQPPVYVHDAVPVSH